MRGRLNSNGVPWPRLLFASIATVLTIQSLSAPGPRSGAGMCGESVASITQSDLGDRDEGGVDIIMSSSPAERDV
jgi:hypothetical protein